MSESLPRYQLIQTYDRCPEIRDRESHAFIAKMLVPGNETCLQIVDALNALANRDPSKLAELEAAVVRALSCAEDAMCRATWALKNKPESRDVNHAIEVVREAKAVMTQFRGEG
jgi:hypothetical protein